MAPLWIIMLTSLYAALRSAAYGIYTWQDENKIGGVGLFIISTACLVITTTMLISILTNL